MNSLSAPHASLSPIQKDIFLDELSGSSQSYVIGLHCRLNRAATGEGLAAAMTRLEPEIREHCRPVWQAAGVDILPESSTACHILDDAGQAIDAPLPLNGPLVHLHFAPKKDGLEILLLSHHILFDGEAIVALLTRLIRLAEGDDSAVDPGAQVDTEEFDAPDTLEFWRDRLVGAEPFMDVRSTADTAKPELIEDSIHNQDAVQRLCRQLKVTESFLFKCLFGLALIELHGVTGPALVEEIVNHRPTTARGSLGCLSALTPFMLPTAEPTQGLDAWIATAKVGQGARKGHERLSQFMSKRLAGPREGYRAIYNYHGYSVQMLDLPGVVPLRIVTSENPLAIQFYLYRSAQLGLRAICSHPRGPRAAQGIVDVVNVLLEQLLADLSTPLSAIALVNSDEVRRLDALNATARPFNDAVTLSQLFDKRAALVPDDLAVSDCETALSFAELHMAVTALAGRLCAEGVQKNDRVGVFLDRSVGMAISVLAVVKAGAAYVPLDTSYPDDRLSYILDDADVSRLLVDETSAQSARQRGLAQNRELVVVGGPIAAPDPGMLAELDARQDPNGTAYVIYTSGSSGQPKGVMLAHRGVVNRIEWMQDHFGLGPQDKILQKTPFGFDVSVWELFWGPLFGIPTHYAPAGAHRDPHELERLLRDERITIVHFVPSMLEVFLNAEVDAPGLRYIVCSGEALGAATHNLALSRMPEAQLVNLYGPTEASIDVTSWQAQPGINVTRVPIGKPIWNTSCHVYSRRGKRLPLGFAGELLLGGVQLAQGYLGKPELTAERFIPDTLGSDPSVRLYRTGDLAAYDQNGDICYLGRMDDQVKIRGLRIEIGEIEQQMLAHSAVTGAVVTAGQGASGQTVLLGYVTLAKGAQNTDAANVILAEITEHLRRVLPEYMLPSGVMLLDEMPLSVNGKVDRKALPAFEVAASTEDYEPPRTKSETILAELWGELLGIDPATISRGAQFFDIGGNSLLLMQVQNVARTRLGVELSMRDAFTRPILKDLAARIDGLPDVAEPATATAPDDADNTQALVSFSQTRLWLLDQIEGSNAQYNLPTVLKVSLPFDVARAEMVLQRLVERHEPLRTTFDTKGTTQVQPEAAVHIRREDLRALPEQTRQDTLDRLLAQEATTGFDLTAAPLLRAVFFQISDDEGWLLVNMHHIASDGWSMGVLLREFFSLWDAPEGGLPPLPLRYSDFARWQRDWTETPEFENHMAYWLDALRGGPEVHQVPLDFPRPERQSFAGADHEFQIDASLASMLRSLGKSRNATLFMVLHAAFAAVLERWSGQSDIVIGTPVANRLRSEFEPLVGFFANTLALRVNCDSDAGFETLLDQVRDVNIAALAHQGVPFELLVDRLNPPRSSQHSPVFQVMFAMDPQDFSAINRNGTTFERVRQPGQTAKFDLLLFAVETGDGGVRFDLEYCRDLFRPETIEMMCACLQLLLEGVAQNSARPLGAIDCLPQHEIRRQVTNLNNTWRPVTLVNICSDIRNRVAEKGDAPAVICGDRALSYAELDRRANRIAHVLLARGEGQGSRVGVCLRPSTDLVCGMLGVLKAQAAYVPIDPGYPENRIAYMLKDSGVQTVLVDRESAEMLADEAHAQGIALLDLTDESCWTDAPTTEPETFASDPRMQLFYTIYTSGSTGNPKAAQVVHHGVQNMLQWYMSHGDAPESHCALVMSSIAFDLTQKGIWAALLLGGRVVFNDLPHFDADHLRVLVDRHAVTRITCAPSAFYPLVEEPRDFGLLTSLRKVFLGGEAIVMKRLRPWLSQSDCTLINYYGPSECTDAVAFTLVPPEQDSPPIGRPLPNTQLYILNKHRRPLPPGALGELYIGGDGVGPGYWGKPDLTMEKFVADPFSGRAGATLYRTGDLVRFLSDGQIAYHGRIDDQVKIRGFRVEMGEIETRITQMPEIAAAAVVADTQQGETWLLAYVTTPEPSASAEETVQAVLRHLRSTLPAHMVPSSVRWLAAMPLSPNGKINRKALPRERVFAPVATAPQAMPATKTEQLLAGIWADLLALNPAEITREADFFALGGNSILVTRLLSRMRQHWAHDISLSDLFYQPDLEGMAALVDDRAQSGSGATLIQKRTTPNERPLTEVQRRIWFLSQLDPEDTSFNIFGAYDIAGQLDEKRLRHALARVVVENPMLRTRFLPGIEPVQVLVDGDEIVLNVLELENAELDSFIMQEAHHRFRLDAEPLLRLTLVKTGASVCLLVNIHHIISDGWSLRLFVDKMRTAYKSLDIPAQADDDSVDYADFAAWQSQQLAGARFGQLSRVWQERLAGHPPPLTLPASRLGLFKGRDSGEFVHPIDADMYGSLKALAEAHGVTPFMLVLALYATLLARHSGQDDLVIGMPVAGRLAPQTETMLGCFINVLPLRLQIQEQAFPDLLKHVKKISLEAFDHQDMPFERIVELVNPSRQVNRNPLFDVMLNWNEALGGELQLDGVRLSAREVPAPTAKYALTLYVDDLDDTLSLRWTYQSDVLSSGYVAALSAQFARLCAQVIDDPEVTLSRVALGDETPHAQDFDQAPLLADQMSRAFSDNADRLAVVGEDTRFTYRELEDQAARVAACIRKAGLGAGSVVAVSGDRGPALIAALVGVVMSGRVVMPIDRLTPPARLAQMVAQAAPPLLLWAGEAAIPEPLADLPMCHIPNAGLTGGDDDVLPAPEQVRDDPAYIFFTSGTTGQPKAILGHQGGLANFLHWQRTHYKIAPGARLAHLTGIGFDVVLRDVFLPLTAGAELHVPPLETALAPDPLFGWMRDNEIAYFHTVPSIMRFWLRQEKANVSLPSLRRIFVAGEPLTRELLQQWRQRVGAGEVTNLYGPTETTLAKFAFDCDDDTGDNLTGALPVGTPLPGTRLKLCNEHGQPCGVGERGEVRIETPDASLGYLGQTMADPFFDLSPRAGQRLIGYRTGDLGFLDPNGLLHLMGRRDDQVKIRGVRLELADVQSTLRSCPALRDAHVLARCSAASEKTLVAYVLPRDLTQDAATLRRLVTTHARTRLPPEMVPSVIVPVDSFRLTANGKLDRTALPDPSSLDTDAPGAVASPPRPGLETQLHVLWQNVLGHDRFGRDEGFFDVGGHSLLLMQLRADLERELGLTLPLVRLFDHPTIETLARLMDDIRRSGSSDTQEQVRKAARDRGDQRLAAMARKRIR